MKTHKSKLANALIKQKIVKNGNQLVSGRRLMKSNFTQIPNFLIYSLLAMKELRSTIAKDMYYFVISQTMGYENTIEVSVKKISKVLDINRKIVFKCIKYLTDLNMIEVIEKEDGRYIRPIIFPDLWNVNNEKINKIVERTINMLEGKEKEDEELKALDDYIKKVQSNSIEEDCDTDLGNL